jgi:adenylate cyclase
MKFKLSLAFKLILITSTLLASVVLFVSYKSAHLFEQVSIDKEESINISMSELKAYTLELLVKNYIENISNIVREKLVSDNPNGILSNDEVLFIKTVSLDSNSRELFLSGVVDRGDSKKKSFLFKLQQLNKYKPQLKLGKIFIFNSSYDEKNLNFILGFPLTSLDNKTHVIVYAQIKSDQILKIFKSNNKQSYFLLDEEGEYIASSDENQLLKNDNSAKFILKSFNGSIVKSQQQYLYDNKKNNWLVTTSRLSFGMYLFSKVSRDTIIAPSEFIKKNSYYLLGLVLSSVIILVFIFSEHISRPIELLTTYAQKIGQGDLSVVATEKIQSSDEVGDLAKSFDFMVGGLKERDKMKTLFSKFHGTAVTKELLDNEIKLGGKRKEMTVFFSDIRGFTDFSEGRTPEEVVSMLNEYFEVMVHIINSRGGVVDKFIGDAIMAVWGVPHQTPDDANNAVLASLEMRMALNSLNESRIERGLTPIKIGMGLHSGEAISGQIGSSERMEFTVIGDAVNTASRIEGSTKSFGTDLLLSKEVVAKLDNKFLLVKAGEAKVQGKSENLVLYMVRGIIENGVENILSTPYSSYEAVEDKKSKVAT